MKIRVRPPAAESVEADLRDEAYATHRRLFTGKTSPGVTKYNISVPNAIEEGTRSEFFGSTDAAYVREYLRQLAAVATDIADRLVEE